MSITFISSSTPDKQKFRESRNMVFSLASQFLPSFIGNLPACFKQRKIKTTHFACNENWYYSLDRIDTIITPRADRPYESMLDFRFHCYTGSEKDGNGETLTFNSALNTLMGQSSGLFNDGNFGELSMQIDPTQSQRLKNVQISEVIMPKSGNKHRHTYFHHLKQVGEGTLVYYATLDSGEKGLKGVDLYSYYALYMHKPDISKPIQYAIMACLGSNYAMHCKSATLRNEIIRLVPYNRDGLVHYVIKELDSTYRMPGKPEDDYDISVKFPNNNTLRIAIKPKNVAD
jgi:hypothetical protein